VYFIGRDAPVRRSLCCRLPASDCVFTPEWHSLHQQLWQQACRQAERAEIVSPEVLKAIATTVQPGVVATAKRSSSQSKVPFTGLGLGLEPVQDPGNLGTIIRTAAAAGATVVVKWR